MEQRTIDTHAHLWSETYLDKLEALGAPDIAVARDIGAGCDEASLRKRFKMMDDAGVKQQILSATPQVPQWGDEAEAFELAQFLNDEYASLCETYSERFVAYAAVPLPYVKAAINEAKRILSKPYFKGIALPTLVRNEIPLTDDRFAPFFKAMNQIATTIYIHPTGTGARSPLVNDFGLEWVVGAPIEDMLVTLQLLKADFPKKYPNLKFHIAHLGGGISFQLQRIKDNYTDWQAFSEDPIENLKKHFWFDAANFSTLALKNIADSLGTDHLFMGSDFPYFQDDKYVRAATYISDAGFNHAETQAILFNNAKTFFKLD